MTQTDKEKRAAEAEEKFLANISETVSGAVQAATTPLTERMAAIEEKMVVMEDSQNDHDLPGSSEAKHKGESYSFAKVFAGIAAGDIERYAPMEFEMSEELRLKQYADPQATTPDDLGGFLVPNEVHNEMIIPLLQDRIIADKLGMTRMQATGSPVEIPMVVSEPTPEAVAENQGTPDQNITFNMMQMTPKTCQTYLVSSRRFLQMGAGAENIIREIIVDGISRTYNQWALTGTGSGGQPIGILNTTGVSTHDWSGIDMGASEVYNELIKTDGVLADAKIYEDGSTPTWVAPHQFVRMLQQMTSGNESAGTEHTEISRKVFTSADTGRIVNRDYVETGTLQGGASPEVILGVWKHMFFAQWGGMKLEASNVAGDAMRRRQTHIVAYTDIDYGVRYPEAFVIAENMATIAAY